MVVPPSTTRLAPVINGHESEAKNTNRLATSSGSHILCRHLPLTPSSKSFLLIPRDSPILRT
jgi:hypothetical protein